MRQLTLSQKVLGGFSLLVGLIALTSYVGYHAASRVFRYLERATSVTLPATDLLLQVDRDLHQALIAERGTLSTRVDAPEFAKLLKDHAENLQQAAERWNAFTALPELPAGSAELIDAYKTRIAVWEAATRRIVEARRSNTAEGSREAVELSDGPAAAQFASARECINQLTELFEVEAAQLRRDASDAQRRAIWTNLAAVAAGLSIGALLVWIIGVQLTRTLRRLAVSLGAGATQTASASAQINTASQQLATGASTQAASIEETSASLEEMSSMTKRNAEHAHEARQLAQHTREAAAAGSAEMEEMTGAVTAIKVSSDKVAAIVKTIDEIAFQTNLLALNAAVEAARAGEAGAGFAVVAEEVRNLAHRSAQAARETSTIIDDSLRASRNGVEISARVATRLKEINTRVLEVDAVIKEIAGASTQQADGVEQINATVSQIDKITQSNAASAEETASAAEELNSQTDALRESIAQLEQLVGGSRPPKDKPASAPTRETVVGVASAPAITDHPERSRPPATMSRAREHAADSPAPAGVNGRASTGSFFS